LHEVRLNKGFLAGHIWGIHWPKTPLDATMYAELDDQTSKIPNFYSTESCSNFKIPHKPRNLKRVGFLHDFVEGAVGKLCMPESEY
jgi:hypothetical protein